MLTRLKKEDVRAYMELKRKRAETMLKEYEEYRRSPECIDREATKQI
ncbi:hypothetical protein M1567_00985 [Candidatus Marsarchaeota archaeon]|jgi:hypothetical protein|nr:hypothetical protein [Candidatus Marsarchaeota archaeon]